MSATTRARPKGRHEQMTAAMRTIDAHATAIEALCHGEHLDAKARGEIRRRCAFIVAAVDAHEGLDTL